MILAGPRLSIEQLTLDERTSTKEPLRQKIKPE